MKESEKHINTDYDDFDLILSNLLEVFGEKSTGENSSENTNGIQLRVLPISIRKRLLYDYSNSN